MEPTEGSARKEDMDAHFRVAGYGYALGRVTVRNEDLAVRLGMPPTWFATHTGIVERRVCDSEQNVLDLAAEATSAAMNDAGVTIADIDADTLLLYIQNGYTQFTPPPAILLCSKLGLRNLRPFSLDGVCAEPIAALQIASLYLQAKLCRRAIVVAAVDFLPVIDPNDKETAGLFGAGAGAVLLEADDSNGTGLNALSWATDTSFCDHGVIPLLQYAQNETGVRVQLGYYQMNGKRLAKDVLALVPRVVSDVLSKAQWTLDTVDIFITHQPNVKLLEIGARQLGIDRSRLELPVRYLGNLGPASLLVSLAMAREKGRLPSQSKALLLAFGLGLSCGAAAVTV